MEIELSTATAQQLTDIRTALIAATDYERAPYTTGLTAVTDPTLDRANGGFQKVTFTGSTLARVIPVPSNGSIGQRLELWVHSTTGDARTLDFNASIVKPSLSTATWPLSLTQGKTYIVLLKHNGTAWMLISLTGGF